jgi:hypothetical protein
MVVTCLVGGGILVSIGVLGEYVARIFEESKGRPLYLVAETWNIAANAAAPAAARSHTEDLLRLQQSLATAIPQPDRQRQSR